MNIKIFLFFLTTIVNIYSLYAQTSTVIDSSLYRLTYNLEYQLDSNDVSHIRKEKILLLIGENKSISISLNMSIRDTLLLKMVTNAVETGSKIDMRLVPKSRLNSFIIKDLNQKEIITFEETVQAKYVYSEETSIMNWNISDEQKNILGYQCQKANLIYGGRNYIAWFTNEIPLNEGPYKFCGLPGLILTINDTKNHYIFKVESIEKSYTKEPIIIYNEERFIDVSRAEFLKIRTHINENLREIMMEIMPVSEGQMELSMENAKKRNNPIELK